MMKKVCDSKEDKDENIWGIPDWRDIGQYPSVDLSIDGWKWEFTRRSKEYQSIWQDYEHNSNKWNTKKKDGMSIADEAAIKFKLRRLKHPNSKLEDPFLRAVETIHDAYFDKCILANDYYLKDFITKAKDQDQCLVCINPRFPLEPQLKNLKKIINKTIADHEDNFSEYTFSDIYYDMEICGVDADEIKTKMDLLRPKKEISRHKTEYYPFYLRLLDARNLSKPHRPTWKKITTYLNENGMAGYTEDRFKNLYKSAISAQNKFLYKV